MFTHADTYTRTHTHTCTHTQTHTHACTHTHICTHTRAHTHTHYTVLKTVHAMMAVTRHTIGKKMLLIVNLEMDSIHKHAHL